MLSGVSNATFGQHFFGLWTLDFLVAFVSIFSIKLLTWHEDRKFNKILPQKKTPNVSMYQVYHLLTFINTPLIDNPHPYKSLLLDVVFTFAWNILGN